MLPESLGLIEPGSELVGASPGPFRAGNALSFTKEVVNLL
jgi:hypothetical protein